MLLTKKITQTPHFMIMPSLACPAACTYCFGPHQGPVMTSEVLEKTIRFIKSIAKNNNTEKVRITFHGGEPLVAGIGYWKKALQELERAFGSNGFKATVQSNLWLFNKQYAALFRQYKVHIGTSVDGPQAITDKQRGDGYFKKTMAGIELARQYGINPGAIVTFTPYSLPFWKTIMCFFEEQQINMIIHPSVIQAGNANHEHVLTPTLYSQLVVAMLEEYKNKRKKMRSSSLDQMVQAVCYGSGQVCTFKKCLGMFLAIDPNGDVFPCQRFGGQKENRLGNIKDNPTLEKMMRSPIARRMQEREEKISEQCHACSHLEYCYGGCFYNAEAAGEKVIDPYCESYQTIYSVIQKELLNEMGKEENINAIINTPSGLKNQHLLLRKGPLSELTRPKQHPMEIARNAKRIVAAVELAKNKSTKALKRRLMEIGVCHAMDSASYSIEKLKNMIKPSTFRLNNLYVHITFRCQLNCDHCYAFDNEMKNNKEMEENEIIKVIKAAESTGFRQVVITGGEPLYHKKGYQLLKTLLNYKKKSNINFVLRSNFSLPIKKELFENCAKVFDQIVVSLDGNEAMHNSRRGKDEYIKVINNIKTYQQMVSTISNAAELSLAAVLKKEDIQGEAGEHIRELAKKYNIKRIRFRPILPLGRAKQWSEPLISEPLCSYEDPIRFIESGYKPVNSCGLGKNLYIEPDGKAFPCYAFHQENSYIGNVINNGLEKVVSGKAFKKLLEHDVDSNKKCKNCDMRYLCGGACRAWGKEVTQNDLDAAPPECHGLYEKANRIYQAARDYLLAK